MEKFKIYWLLMLITLLASCAKDDNTIGDIPPLKPEYSLPQGKSPADNRIVELYNKYGTYILYDYTDADFKWLQVDINNVWKGFKYTLPDPQYAGDIIDFLEKSWFRFYPEEFNKKFIPYKIFLTSSLSYESDYDETAVEYFVRSSQSQMVVSFCSDRLNKMSATEKIELKNELQEELWGKWLGEFDIPKEFYAVSDYSYIASDDPVDWNYARELGFIADRKGEEWSTIDPWPNSKLSEATDLASFLSGLRNRTSAQWTEDLKYPLVKKKYDILRNYFLEKYKFDIQKIGDANVQ